MIERSLNAESSDPTDRNDPTENADNADPIDPTDSTDPIEPTDSIEPFEQMQRNESSDLIDHRELLTGQVSRTNRNRGEAVRKVSA
jgi:hypothetical protein